jgi:hypothetical protein
MSGSTTRDINAKMSSAYGRVGNIGVIDLAGAGDENLKKLFKLSSKVLFYTREPEIFADLSRVFEELERRKLVTKDIASAMYQRAHLQGNFQEAFAISKKYAIEYHENFYSLVPGTRVGEGWDVWNVDLKTKAIKEEKFALPKGTFVVVIGSPSCGFSRRAAEAIEHDDEMLRAMQGRIKWILSPGAWWGPDDMAEWNTAHPFARFSIPMLPKQLVQIDSWETPTFYVFNDGILVDQFAGWPEEGKKKKLLNALNRQISTESK